MIKEIIKNNFTLSVIKDDETYRVVFTGSGGQEGYIIFKPAKRGWSNKPISRNAHIVVDAEMYQVIDTIKNFLDINENDINDVRQTLTQLSLVELNDFLSTSTH